MIPIPTDGGLHSIGGTQMRTAIVYADKHIGRHRAEDLDARCRMFASDHGLLVIETVYGHRDMDVFGWTLAQIVGKHADVLIVPTIGHLRHHRLSEVTAVCDLMVVDSETVHTRRAEPDMTAIDPVLRLHQAPPPDVPWTLAEARTAAQLHHTCLVTTCPAKRHANALLNRAARAATSMESQC